MWDLGFVGRYAELVGDFEVEDAQVDSGHPFAGACRTVWADEVVEVEQPCTAGLLGTERSEDVVVPDREIVFVVVVVVVVTDDVVVVVAAAAVVSTPQDPDAGELWHRIRDRALKYPDSY